MPIVWCDTTGSCFYFVSRSGNVVEFCASNRSECLEWYSIIRETIEMCVASSSVTSLLKVGNSSKQRRPDRRRSSDEDDLSIRDGANLITVTCLQNSLLRIPKCADIEQAWYVCVFLLCNPPYFSSKILTQKKIGGEIKRHKSTGDL